MNLADYRAKPQETLAQHTNNVLEALDVLWQLGYIKGDHLYQLTKSACRYHDLGKMNPVFQNRIISGGRFDPQKEIGHNILSVYFIDPKAFGDPQDYYLVVNGVLNHHHYTSNLDKLYDDKYQPLIQSLLKEFTHYPVSARTPGRVDDIRETDEAILLMGYLYKCDYSASAGIPIEYANDFLLQGLEDLLMDWQKDNGSAKWNALQQFCQSNRHNNLVITAPTGMGKTEAGLLWIGDSKGFFVLPLKTAINAIYLRVKDSILHNVAIHQRVALLHGDSLSYYNQSKQNEEMDIMDYYTKSKQLSIPLNISTPDQLFDFVFKYPGYELKLATMAYAKVVIDEIQAYGPDLLAYLIYGLKRITQLGGQFAILTATLPPFIKDLLGEVASFAEADFSGSNGQTIRHHLQVEKGELISDHVKACYQCNPQQKILVVCNTVKKAQKLYNELKDLGNVHLLHSKFTKADRLVKEKLIIDHGKTYSNQEKTVLNTIPVIWIATSIVEASLDIDFDYLITELSDLNGLLQRLGRCNRKGVKSVEAPNCLVFTEIDKHILVNGNRGFIDKTIYALSKEAVEPLSGLLSEQEKSALINQYLTTDRLRDGKSDFLSEYDKYYRFVESLYLDEKTKKQVALKFRNIIAYDVIPQGVYEKYQSEIDDALDILATSGKGNSEDERKQLQKEKIKAKDTIMQHTVSVGHYDVYFKKGHRILQRLKISGKQEIWVIAGEYDTELGFCRTNEELKAGMGEIEEIYDSFM